MNTTGRGIEMTIIHCEGFELAGFDSLVREPPKWTGGTIGDDEWREIKMAHEKEMPIMVDGVERMILVRVEMKMQTRGKGQLLFTEPEWMEK
jgi:hypothetical protein